MKKLSRDEMKKVMGGGNEAPPEGTSKCCVGTECTACVHDGGIDCAVGATRVVCTRG